MACFNIPGDAALSADGRTFLLVTGSERLAQRLRVGIRTILGSYKYNQRTGIDWFRLLDKRNQQLLRTEIRGYFLSHPEVSSILSLEFLVERSTRMMSVAYRLRLADGEFVEATSPITPLQ